MDVLAKARLLQMDLNNSNASVIRFVRRASARDWSYSDNAATKMTALSEYDQSLAEARRTNRMTEALELFKSICNNRAFANTSIMLFLNKKDVFAEKILYSDVATQKPFSDYAGPTKDFNNGVLYFIQKFKECLIDVDFNDSFIHVTCATDTNNMEFVLDSTRTIIMTDNLRRSGFLGSGWEMYRNEVEIFGFCEVK